MSHHPREIERSTGPSWVLRDQEIHRALVGCERSVIYIIKERCVHCEYAMDIPQSSIHDERRYTNGRGQKLQAYSIDGKTLLRTYDGPTDAMRDPVLDAPSNAGFKFAIDGNSVYRDRRWAWLARSLPNATVQEIGETSETQEPKKGFVAMLNIDKTAVVNLYGDMQDAAEDRELNSTGAISMAIKFGRCHARKYFFEMWDNLTPKVQSTYAGDLPTPRQRSNAQIISAVNTDTGDVRRFTCIQEAVKEMHVGRVHLKAAIESGEVLRGFRWTAN